MLFLGSSEYTDMTIKSTVLWQTLNRYSKSSTMCVATHKHTAQAPNVQAHWLKCHTLFRIWTKHTSLWVRRLVSHAVSVECMTFGWFVCVFAWEIRCGSVSCTARLGDVGRALLPPFLQWHSIKSTLIWRLFCGTISIRQNHMLEQIIASNLPSNLGNGRKHV